ncbi:MAG: trehalose-phosphatase [Acetobacteraceae bacterium]|jgi:trehalose 6-phosphate phosphatase|nr:trehalose-phosphatase [Acetobacteraceae bacterium]
MSGTITIPPREVARRGAVFLDFDGTLVEIAPLPDAITVPPGLPGLLSRLAALTGGATALLSGRTIETLDRFLAPARLAAAGGHGAELRRSPQAPVEHHAGPALPPSWLVAAEALAARHPGALLERKPAGFTLHARACPDALPHLADALAALVAGNRHFVLLKAHMAVEVRPAGADKGTALAALMSAPPFAGRMPVFVGDDVTDEDAIAAAVRLGGIGLRVDEAFGSPAGVRGWLAEIAGAAVAEGAAR